jgi:solute carrier family 25 protein 39/40
MLLTVPATAFYFTFYQSLRASIDKSRLIPEWSTPLAAGPIARSATVLLSAPLELVRTRVQARAADIGRSDATVAIIRNVVRSEGFTGLFRGVWPTLWRDVPFSMR